MGEVEEQIVGEVFGVMFAPLRLLGRLLPSSSEEQQVLDCVFGDLDLVASSSVSYSIVCFRYTSSLQRAKARLTVESRKGSAWKTSSLSNL